MHVHVCHVMIYKNIKVDICRSKGNFFSQKYMKRAYMYMYFDAKQTSCKY